MAMVPRRVSSTVWLHVPASDLAELCDGQTTWIKIIPFVWPSQVRVAGRMSCAGGLSDGQTNWLKLPHSSGLRRSVWLVACCARVG